MKLLIVDDSEPVRELSKRMLTELADIEIVGECGSVKEAVLLIQQKRPEVVQLDFNLEDGTGLDVMKKCEADKSSIIFVVFTVHETDQYRQACLAAGADYFLSKGMGMPKLRELLVKLATQMAKK